MLCLKSFKKTAGPGEEGGLMRTPNRGIDSARGPASHLASLVNALTANQKVVRRTSGLCLPA